MCARQHSAPAPGCWQRFSENSQEWSSMCLLWNLHHLVLQHHPESWTYLPQWCHCIRLSISKAIMSFSSGKIKVLRTFEISLLWRVQEDTLSPTLCGSSSTCFVWLSPSIICEDWTKKTWTDRLSWQRHQQQQQQQMMRARAWWWARGSRCTGSSPRSTASPGSHSTLTPS